MVKIWNKFFRKKTKKASSEVDTIPIKKVERHIAEQDAANPLEPQPASSSAEKNSNKVAVRPPQLMASCAQSVGIQRDHNEDSLFCMTTMTTGNGGATPFGIYIVADGMGGHQHGEVASEIATRTMASHLVKEVFAKLIAPDPRPPEESLQEIMRKGIQKAHDNIVEKVTGGGTTLTAVTIFSQQMTIAHVGDSRIYQVRPNGRMKALTRDHSLVKRLEELGQLTPAEAAVDPRRNVLYHALGQGTPLEPEIISMPLPRSGYILVCSDGLWGVVAERAICDIIQNSDSLSQACQEMVDAANAAGGPDNISVILVRLPD